MKRNETVKQKLVDVDGISRNESRSRKRENRGKTRDKRDHAETETGAETKEPQHVCALDHKQEMYGLFVIVVTDGRGSRCSNKLFIREEN